MCIVSTVGDYWEDRIKPNYPPVQTYPQWDDNEKERLKRDVLALKIMLKAALEFDEKTGQPHCEHEDKIKSIKLMAKAAGVDLDFL